MTDQGAIQGDAADGGGTPAADELVTVNKSGQSLGQKGHRTRLRILQATRELIESQRGLAPAAAAVAREAGISSPTFYLYFADVGEAILDVVAQIADEFDPVEDVLLADWPLDRALESARSFVRAYFDYWMAHAAVLRVRNRLADQGDQRFTTLRIEQGGRLSEPLTAKLADGVVDGQVVAERRAVAGVLITALERTATVEALQLYPQRSASEATIDALALMIFRAMTG
jgi:AcrR family transcriptional regulator